MDNFGFEKILHSHLVFKDEGEIMDEVNKEILKDSLEELEHFMAEIECELDYMENRVSAFIREAKHEASAA